MGGLLIIAAHPDDETVGAASLLLRAEQVAVVHVTDGAPRDPALRPGHPDREAYARVRRREALEALAVAGVPRGRAVALSAVDQEAVQLLAPLARELAGVLAAVAPRIVVTHAFEGGHPDHDATALAVRAARVLLWRRSGRAPRLVEMAGYHRGGDRLVAGAFLAGPRAVRHRLTRGEREAKRRMLGCYASQRRVLSTLGLDGVAEERFRVAPTLWPWPRPHAGPLHYEVQGWTTFEAFRAQALDALHALGIDDLDEAEASEESAGAAPC